MTLPESIRRTWTDTDYRVRLPEGGHASIRCGKPLPPALRALLNGDTQTWGYVTAWNPASVALARAVNRERQRRLRDALRALGLTFRAGIGVGSGDWQEPSLFVPGIDFTTLDRVARQFGQVGVVRGTAGGIAELHELL